MSEQTPTLVTLKTFKITCCGCKRHIATCAKFIIDDWFGKGWHCEHCGCTSAHLSEGRPIGKKHRDWEWLEKLFADCWSSADEYDKEDWRPYFVFSD